MLDLGPIDYTAAAITTAILVWLWSRNRPPENERLGVLLSAALFFTLGGWFLAFAALWIGIFNFPLAIWLFIIGIASAYFGMWLLGISNDRENRK